MFNTANYLLAGTTLLFVLVWFGTQQEADRTEFWVPAGDESAVVLQIHGSKAFLACRDGETAKGLIMEDLSQVVPLNRRNVGSLEKVDSLEETLVKPGSETAKWCSPS